MRRRKTRYKANNMRNNNSFNYLCQPGNRLTSRAKYKYDSGSKEVNEIFHESVECLNTVKECLDIIFDLFS